MQIFKITFLCFLLAVLGLEYSNLSPLLNNLIAEHLKNNNNCGCSDAICCCDKSNPENLCMVFSESSKVNHLNDSNMPKNGQKLLNCAGSIQVFTTNVFKNVLQTHPLELVFPQFIRNKQFRSPKTLKPLLVKNRIFRPPKTSII